MSSKEKKLSKEEISKIEEIQARTKTVQIELGKIELEKLNIESKRASIDSFITETKILEVQIAEALETKYGAGVINIDKFTFTADTKDT